MKRILFFSILSFFVVSCFFGNMISNFSNDALSELLSGLNANIALGEPIAVGETLFLPIFKAEAGFFAGAGGPGKVYGSGTGGAIKLLPYAIAVLSENSVQIIPITNEKSFLEQVTDILPELLPLIKELMVSFMTVSPVQTEELYPDSEKATGETNDIGAFTLFFSYRNELLETLQDAYSYLLLNDPAIKQEYYGNLLQTEKALIIFENVIRAGESLKSEHSLQTLNQTKVSLFSIKNQIENIFNVFDEKREIPKDAINALFGEVERINPEYESMEDTVYEAAVRNGTFLGSGVVGNQVNDKVKVFSFLFAAIEANVFNYVEHVYRSLLSDNAGLNEMIQSEIKDILLLTRNTQEYFYRIQNEEISLILATVSEFPVLFQTINEMIDRGSALLMIKQTNGILERENILQFKTIVDIYTRLTDAYTEQLKDWLEVHS
jgi:uncharacterized spore protein YtfJ